MEFTMAFDDNEYDNILNSTLQGLSDSLENNVAYESTPNDADQDAAYGTQSDISNLGILEQARLHHDEGIPFTDEEIDAIADIAITYVKQILGFFGESKVTIDEYEGEQGELILDINGGDLAVLIGRHGRTLDSFQSLVSAYLTAHLKFYYPLVIDIEGYKTRRKEKIMTLARSAAHRAKKQQGSVSLASMNAYERRLVHLALIDDVEVTTHSVGEDPNRHVVVTFIQSSPTFDED